MHPGGGGRLQPRVPRPRSASRARRIGTELTSNAILRWQQERGVGWHYIAPGKPMQNGFVESFNGRLRASASTNISSPAWPKRGGSSRNGGTTTTQHARTRAWMGSHPTSLQPAPP